MENTHEQQVVIKFHTHEILIKRPIQEDIPLENSKTQTYRIAVRYNHQTQYIIENFL